MLHLFFIFFFFNDTATTEIYTLSLHDALPIEACGARVSVKDACARYGVGSLVNTFAPMRLGDAARVVLFSRTLPQDGGRTLTTGGALGAIGLSRALVQGVLVAVAASVGALPVWPVVALAGLASCGLLVTFLVRHRLPRR